MQQSETRQILRTDRRGVLLKALAFFIPLSCIVCLLLWRIYDVQRHAHLEAIVFDEQARLELFADKLETSLQQTVKDLLFLETLQTPRLFLQEPSPMLRSELEDIFVAMARRKGIYDQIRLLDAKGREVVRVNFNQGAPAPVPQARLQDKSDRYYFQDAINLPPEQVFISPLDLNVEHGEVERPFKPMLRLATTIPDARGNKAGVLLLNVLAEDMLSQLDTDSPNTGKLMLMNRKGFWLKGLTPDEEFGFMFPKNPALQELRFQNRHPEVWKAALKQTATQQLTRDGLFCTRIIRPLQVGQWSSSGAAHPAKASTQGVAPSQYFWMLASHMPMSVLVAQLPSPTRYLLLGGALVFLFAAGSYVLSLFHGHLRTTYQQLRISYQSLQDTEHRLRDREAFYRSLFENNLAMLMLVSPQDGGIEQANAAAASFYGYPFTAFAAMSLQDLDERHDDAVLAELQEASGKQSMRLFATHVLSNHERREMELYIGPVQHDGRSLLFCILHDVTEQRHAERELRERERLLSTISNAAQDAIIMIGPDDTAVFWNPAAEKMFGYSYEEVQNTSLHALITLEEDRERALAAMQHYARTGEGPLVNTLAELNALKKNGEEFPVEVSVSSLQLDTGWGAVASVRDITERKEFEHKLHILATTDPLTGLANRRQFMDVAERELKRARRHNQGLAMLMLDLDHFKLVNDTYGHDAGDKVLQNVANVCMQALRSEDTCGRIGGEEIAMIITETDRQGAKGAAERIRQGIEKSPVEYNGKRISITASIGVALAFEQDADTVPALLNKADAALYKAKEHGRNRVEPA